MSSHCRPACTLVKAAIHDRDAVHRLLVEHRADAVMHFAAWLAVGESVRKPIEYFQNNVTGTLAVLEAMRDAGVKRFIFSSTCAVYGEPATVPIVETLEKHPINAYGETKLTIERALPHLEARYGIKWIALRYFNAAGAHPDGSIGEDHADEIHLIPLAIRAANGGTPLKVFGEDYPTPDGTCLRDYIHVCDLADAHIRALEALERGLPSGAYNVGTGTPHSVKAVIDTVGPGRRPPRRLGIGAAPAGRSCGTLCSQRPCAARTGLAAAIRRSGGHRPARLAMAFHPSARVCRMSHTASLMDAFLRLLRYATPHRAVIAGAALAMVVYGIANAALAYLIKPIIDDVLIAQNDLAAIAGGDPGRCISSRASARIFRAT